MSRQKPSDPTPRRLKKGFVQTGGLLSGRIRKATEKRGFVEARLLTHWAEIVGAETAATARPVKVGYGREGFGATLTLLTTGANAPMLQAELPKIRDRVNAVYGYAAISHIRLTQTDATGFSEGRAVFNAAPAKPVAKPAPDAKSLGQVEADLVTVENEALRSALAALGRNILTRS